jgi:hypothetical protein
LYAIGAALIALRVRRRFRTAGLLVFLSIVSILGNA